jgi:hypothetical protein
MRTKATLDGIVIPAGIHFPVPSPWRRADLPEVCIEFPRSIPSVEFSVSLFTIFFAPAGTDLGVKLLKFYKGKTGKYQYIGICS